MSKRKNKPSKPSRPPVPRMVRDLIEKCNSTLALFVVMTPQERARELRRVFALHSLVFGVYPDDDVPCGVGYLILKGEHLLRDAVATNVPLAVTTGYAPTLGSVEEALHMRDLYGDGGCPEHQAA